MKNSYIEFHASKRVSWRENGESEIGPDKDITDTAVLPIGQFNINLQRKATRYKNAHIHQALPRK